MLKAEKIKKESKSIYIIKNLENGRIKIGISENIKSRFENLVCASGCKLELLYVSKKTDIAEELEKTIHNILSENRYIGEWFIVDESKAFDVVISCIDMIGFDYNKKEPITYFEKINLNSYKRLDSGIYSDSQGNIISISYFNNKWKVEKLEKID